MNLGLGSISYILTDIRDFPQYSFYIEYICIHTHTHTHTQRSEDDTSCIYIKEFHVAEILTAGILSARDPNWQIEKLQP